MLYVIAFLRSFFCVWDWKNYGNYGKEGLPRNSEKVNKIEKSHRKIFSILKVGRALFLKNGIVLSHA